MAKQHSSLTGVDLHDPKGIGAKNTTKVLHISQSVNRIDISGSIIPTNNNTFNLGESGKIFSTGSFGIINVGGSNFDATALGGGNFNTLTNIPSGIISGSGQLPSGIISGSGQLPNGIVSSSVLSSGAQGTITLTTNDVAVNIDSGLQVGDTPTFAGLNSTGDIVVQGKLTAETYAVSSSVTHMTRSFSSGSTIFGDDILDTHQFTGSLLISGSLVDSNIVSGSAQISSDISGSFSLSRLPVGIISGSGQLPSGVISGSGQLPSGVISGSGQLPSGTISGSGQIDTTWNLGADGTDHYTFDGPGLTGAENDPALYLTRGEQYRFINKMGAHPFRIQSDHYGATGTAYNDGVTNNDVQDGVLVWDVQFDSPSVLFYQCTAHPNMGGPIYISNPNDYLPITGSGVISGSVLSSPSQGTVRLQTNGINTDVDTGLQSADSPTFGGLTLTSHVTASGNISGSSTSTGSLGSLIIDGASIDFSNIPDSDPAVAGRVFRNGTDLKISTGGV